MSNTKNNMRAAMIMGFAGLSAPEWARETKWFKRKESSITPNLRSVYESLSQDDLDSVLPLQSLSLKERVSVVMEFLNSSHHYGEIFMATLAEASSESKMQAAPPFTLEQIAAVKGIIESITIENLDDQPDWVMDLLFIINIPVSLSDPNAAKEQVDVAIQAYIATERIANSKVEFDGRVIPKALLPMLDAGLYLPDELQQCPALVDRYVRGYGSPELFAKLIDVAKFNIQILAKSTAGTMDIAAVGKFVEANELDSKASISKRLLNIKGALSEIAGELDPVSVADIYKFIELITSCPDDERGALVKTSGELNLLINSTTMDKAMTYLVTAYPREEE